MIWVRAADAHSNPQSKWPDSLKLPGPSFQPRGRLNYFRLPEIEVKVVERLVPTAVTPVIITTAISAAIKPYSMAVAPDSFRKK